MRWVLMLLVIIAAVMGGDAGEDCLIMRSAIDQAELERTGIRQTQRLRLIMVCVIDQVILEQQR
jgi:hypothetical protein